MPNEIKIQLPDYLQQIKGREFIYVDKEVVNVINLLWDYGIITLGICDGHKDKKPSVVIDRCYNNNIIKIKNIINTIDKRDWKILQWKLVEV